jgi:hypothetical protein
MSPVSEWFPTSALLASSSSEDLRPSTDIGLCAPPTLPSHVISNMVSVVSAVASGLSWL